MEIIISTIYTMVKYQFEVLTELFMEMIFVIQQKFISTITFKVKTTTLAYVLQVKTIVFSERTLLP